MQSVVAVLILLGAACNLPDAEGSLSWSYPDAQQDTLRAAATSQIVELLGIEDYDQSFLELLAPIYLAGRLRISEAISALQSLERVLPSTGPGVELKREVRMALTRLDVADHLDEFRELVHSRSGIRRLEAARALLEFNDSLSLRVLREAVRSRNIELVLYAVESLVRVKDRIAKDYLEGGLTHPDPNVRLQSAGSMSYAGWNDGRHILQEEFTSSSGPRKRWAAEALVRLHDPQASQFMIGLLDSGDPEDQAAAVFALGWAASAAAREPLEDRLVRGTPESRLEILMQGAVGRALGNIGDHRSLPALSACMSNNPHPLVRAACAGAIIQVLDGIQLEMYAVVPGADAP